VRLAVERLGLNSVSRFDPDKRVIEYMIGGDDEPLASASVRRFVEQVGSRTPAPGGGSAAALIAALGAALGAMVGWLTYGKRRFEDKDAVMRRLIPPLHEASQRLIPLIDEDTRAFERYLAAVGLPRQTAEEQAVRQRAMQDALRDTIAVPLGVMRAADGCWEPMLEMARHGNTASRSDLEVGARALETGLWGAWRNVRLNLADIEDETFKGQVVAEAEAMVARAQQKSAAVLALLDARE
jgi:glutamate formiminotransferase/formiminotetrahydrofolate cyclodeaminase